MDVASENIANYTIMQFEGEINMLNEKLMHTLNTLCADTEFAEKFSACDSAEAMASLLADKGVAASVFELNELLAAVSAQANSDELNEESLDAVSGGSIVGAALYALYKALKKNRSSSGGGTGSFGGGAGGGGGR